MRFFEIFFLCLGLALTEINKKVNKQDLKSIKNVKRCKGWHVQYRFHTAADAMLLDCISLVPELARGRRKVAWGQG